MYIKKCIFLALLKFETKVTVDNSSQIYIGPTVIRAISNTVENLFDCCELSSQSTTYKKSAKLEVTLTLNAD